MALENKDIVLHLPQETLDWFGGDELRALTYYEKYSLRGPDGKQTENTPDKMWRRVAHEMASVEITEEKRKEWEDNFYWLLSDWRFIPGGRILFGAGQSRKSTLLNCYVLAPPTDSIEGIFETAKEMARTYSYGGGVGIDISNLRPKGAAVNNSAIVSTGAVSFMELYSVTTGTIGQAGRRGALMLSISVEHPDVEDFVNIKKDLKRVNFANISVRVTDAFMKAVENDTDFRLHFDNEKAHMTKVIKARDLWNQLVNSAWQSAEPGLLFWDTIKRMSTTEYDGMEVAGVNPCVLPDTMILGDNIQIAEMSQGNNAFGMNGLDNNVSQKFVREYKGNMVQVKASGLLPVITTPEHPVYSNGEWVPAGEVKVGDYLAVPRLQGTIKLESIDLSPYKSKSKYNKYDQISNIKLDKDIAWLLGLYVAEGHGITHGVGFSFNKNEIDLQQRTQTILNNLGFNSFIREKRTAMTVCAYSNLLQAFLFDTCGHLALNKKIPDFILRHKNEEILRAFLDGYLQGDGYLNYKYKNDQKNVVRVSTISKTLALQIQLAYTRLGILPWIYVKKQPEGHLIEGRKINTHTAYDVWISTPIKSKYSKTKTRISPDFIFTPVKTTNMLDYQGEVHNIRTSDNTYLVSNAIVHNCSEETLESYGSCCLGSINLSAFVEAPFSADPKINLGSLDKAFIYATRFLDNVLDYNADKHPLPAQKKASLWGRRIGVGITGLGDMLIKMKMKYDDEPTVKFVDGLMAVFKHGIYMTSISLAAEKGSFPGFDAKKHLAQPFIQQLSADLQEGIATIGLRNSAISTVPPVGSGSILAGSSSGVEPVFAFSYKRRSHSLSQGEFEVKQPIVKEYEASGGDPNNLPSYFIASHQIKPEFRVAMQGVIQKHIDTAISSTINLPEDVSKETVGQIYFNAWKAGCKGVTVYREGSRQGILETADMGKKKQAEMKLDSGGDVARPKIMEGKTIKLHMVQGSLYVTLNGNGHAKEAFITLGKHGQEAKADAEAIGRLISMYLQSGGTVESVIASLKGIQGGQISWDNGTKLLSIPDAVAKALGMLIGQSTHTKLPWTPEGIAASAEAELAKEYPKAFPDANVEVSAPKLEICPDCHETSLIESGGCRTCESCGYSKCG